MTKEQNILFEFIDDLLRYEWDPLGMNGHGPGDEYESYVPQLFGLAIGNATAEQIAQRLRELETQTIGVAGDFEKCRRLARIIVQKKEALLKA
jgi:bacterioferritin-associated ferredoxin